MSYKTVEILEQIKNLSVIETTELVEDIKDTFNLHPSRELLMSWQARINWVEPDLKPY